MFEYRKSLVGLEDSHARAANVVMVTNNSDPYAGFTGSVGAEFKVIKHIDMAAEFYTAPGNIYTGRTRFAWRW